MTDCTNSDSLYKSAIEVYHDKLREAANLLSEYCAATDCGRCIFYTLWGNHGCILDEKYPGDWRLFMEDKEK